MRHVIVTRFSVPRPQDPATADCHCDPEWLDRYDQVFGRKDKALVPIQDGVCSGCHMKLPPYIIHDAKKRAEMVSCEFCGRLLY